MRIVSTSPYTTPKFVTVELLYSELDVIDRVLSSVGSITHSDQTNLTRKIHQLALLLAYE